LGEKYAISTFAVTKAECATFRQPAGNFAQEVVWLGAKSETVLCVALVPTLAA